MNPKRFNPAIIFALFLAFIAMSGARAAEDRLKDDLHSPLRITIKIPKKVFKINEPINGTVIVKNTYPATLPALFKIQVFREGQHFSESITSVAAIPFGTTKFSFKSFGVPDFNYGPGSEGNWRINIIQQNTDPSSLQGVNLRVMAPAIKKGKSKKSL